MENSQSLSHSYSESIDENQRFDEYIDNQSRADLAQNIFNKENQKASSKKSLVDSFEVKIPAQESQTRQTAPQSNQNSVNISNLKNRYILPKRPRQSIGSQNIDRKELLERFSQTGKKFEAVEKLPNLPQTNFFNQENGFKRSKPVNHRRSLHIMMSDKKQDSSKNPKEQSFVKHNRKSISSHVNSARRYVDQSSENHNYNSETNIAESPSHQIEKEKIINLMREKVLLLSNRLLKEPRSKSKNNSRNQITIKEEVIYKEPQRNSQRIVVFIKTYILSPFQSISLEISVLKGSVVIVGKLLGQEIDTLKLILTPERSDKVFAQSFNDWEIVGKRVFVQVNDSGVKQLKIAPLKSVLSTMIKSDQIIQTTEGNTSQISNQQSKQKNLLFAKQTQFIKRNYYFLMSKNAQTLNTKQQSAVSSINPSNQSTINHKQNDVEGSKKTKERIPSIDLKEHLARQNKHFNYLSPEIKSQLKDIQNQKNNSLMKENLQRELRSRQALIIKQKQQIQRLSKPKETIKSKSKQPTKSKADNAKSMMSKQKKAVFRTVNGNNFQIQPPINQSNNIKDAQSRIDIKISITGETDKSKQSKLRHRQDLDPYSNKPYYESTSKRQEAPQWNEIGLQKTDSIDHIHIDKQNYDEKHSEFDESEKNPHQMKIQGSKALLNNMPRKSHQSQPEQVSVNDYGEEDFEPQHVQILISHNRNTQMSEKELQKNHTLHNQKALQSTALPPPKQKLIQIQKSDPIEDENQEILIQDIDEDDYGNSFEQFKEEKPQTNSQKINNIGPSGPNAKKSQNQQDNYEEAYEEQISNNRNDEKIPSSKNQNNDNEYQEHYEDNQEQKQQNIIEENDLLDDDQIINKIQEDYLDDDFQP